MTVTFVKEEGIIYKLTSESHMNHKGWPRRQAISVTVKTNMAILPSVLFVTYLRNYLFFGKIVTAETDEEQSKKLP